MPQNNLAYSLIFKVIGDAVAKIREIANVMEEPTAAVAALGDASEASSVRQVSAFARAKDAVNSVGEAMAKPIERAAEMGRAAGEAAEKFSKSMGGIGAIAAEGFSVKDVAQQEEFFMRLQINSGMAKSAMEDLREAISKTSDQYGVSKDKMLAALVAYRDMGGNPAAFGEQANNVAIAVQGTGMDPGNAGLAIASLAKLGITDPKQVLSTLAQMNEQLGGVPDRMNAAAEASGRLVASMQSLHLAGTQGALALNAVYAVAARSSGGNARLARSETDSWLTQLADRGYQNQLSQGLGERITDRNGFVMDPRIIMQKMAEKYAAAMKLPQDQQAVTIQRLNSLFGDDASRMFRSVGGEINSTGHSKTIEDVLGTNGDSTELLKKADEASKSLSASMARLRTAMEGASEAVFTGPIDLLATALDHCNGIVAYAVIGLAGLVIVGTALNWMTTTAQNLRLLAAALGISTAAAEADTAATEGQAAASVTATTATEAQTAATTALAVANDNNAVAALAATGATEALAGAAGTAAVASEGAAVGFGALWAFLEATPIGWIITGIAAAGLGLFELPKLFGSTWSNWFSSMRDGLLNVSDYFARALASGLAFFGMDGGDAAKAAEASPAAGDNSGPLSPSSWFGGTSSGISPLATGGSAHGLPSSILDYWRAQHMSDAQARGITAGIMAESRGDPNAMNGIGAMGIGQWLGSRKAALIRRYGLHPTLNQQLDFMNSELHGGDRGGAAVLGAPDAASALNAYIRDFMRPRAGAETAGDLQRGMLALGGVGVGGPVLAANPAMPAPYMTGFNYGKVTRSSIYGPGTAGGVGSAVPASIYGPGLASNDAAPGTGAIGEGGASAQGSAPRAHVTISIDAKGRVKAHLDHSENMEAHLDRGPGMTLAWG